MKNMIEIPTIDSVLKSYINENQHFQKEAPVLTENVDLNNTTYGFNNRDIYGNYEVDDDKYKQFLVDYKYSK